MASEDVIDLGSSDDDAEPEPKKAKTVPNVMVHIPRKLPGVTIKPAKRKVSPILEKLAAKPITVTKIKTLNPNPYAVKNKHIGRNDVKKLLIPPKVYNPIQNLPRIINPHLMINPVNNKQLKQPIKIQDSFNKLPPNITIKRTPTNIPKPVGLKPVSRVTIKSPRKIMAKKVVTEVPTVELDDDDCPSSTASGPQWYLRPEEQVAKLSLEEENNKEPDKSKIIEITIEDSPVKPLPDKRAYEIGAELAITIEDSPIKPLPKGSTPVSGSDDERDINEKEPNSRKKLEYSKEEDIAKAKTIEIELEPIVLDIQNKDNDINKQEVEVSLQDDVVEIQENVTTEKPLPLEESVKDKPDTINKDTVDIVEVNPENKEDTEFHPVYQSFIDLCFKLENSDDMKKIVEKKIKGYYRQVPKDYTESETFIDMVTSKIMSIKAGPEKMYLYIKDIVDELNLQRKMAKSQATTIATATTANQEESNKFLYGENSEFDSKRQRQVRKLEKTLKKLHRAIQLLEEQEVDFDDEDDSVYLLTERYKERMVRVHAKFCQLTNTKMPSEPRVQIDARPGQPAGPVKRLEKWINRKVPIGTPLPFPDFHDVLRCVREANEEDKLGWNEALIMEEARDLFTRCGKKLQRRRQENEWRLAASRINIDEDPAEKNEDLKNKLEINRHVAAKKEIEVFKKYADRQNLLKLEAEEIGDKEAEESPVESEDDDNNDEGSSLLNKEKRKERIKRLLQEKSKRLSNEQRQTDEKNAEKTEELTEHKITEEDNKEETTPENKENKIDSDVTNLDTIEKEDLSQEEIHSLSDDSNRISSDIDELHLLEKLHSEKEMLSSTLESSDSDTPIAISDTLSSGDNRKQASDVISIENSSYSESEVDPNAQKVDDEPKSNVIEIKNTNSPEKSVEKTNNDEYNDSVENILLASSDEESALVDHGMEEGISVSLQNDSKSSEDNVKLRNETTIESIINSERKSPPINHNLGKGVFNISDGCNNMGNKCKELVAVGNSNLEKDTVSTKDVYSENDTGSTAMTCDQKSNEGKLIHAKDTITNKNIVGDDIQVCNKPNLSSNSDLESVKKAETIVEKLSNEDVNVLNVDMTEDFRDKVEAKEFLPSKDSVDKEPISNIDSNVTVEEVENLVNLDLIEKSPVKPVSNESDTKSMKIVDSTMEVDELPMNASPGLIV